MKNYKNSTRKGNQPPGEHFSKKVGFINKVGDANWWMVGLTALVGIVSVAQWQVAKQTLTVANRAYVTANAHVLPARGIGTGREAVVGQEKTPFQEGDIPYVSVEIVNRGQTPAIGVVDSMS